MSEQNKQEPVAWAVVGDGDWGKWVIGNQFETNDPPNHNYWINRGYELVPLYTTPQPQEFVCSTGLCHFTLTQTNVGIGERGMEAYEAAKKRGWVGVSDERLMEMPKQEPAVIVKVWHDEFGDNHAEFRKWHTLPDGEHALYTTPQAQREPLTDEHPLMVFAKECVLGAYQESELADAAHRAIEAAYSIKGKA